MAASSSFIGSVGDHDIKNEVYLKHLKYPQLKRGFGATDSDWATESWFWAPNPELGFVPCSALEKSGDTWKVKLKTGEEITVKKDLLEPMNPPAYDGIEDMANLGELYNSTVLHNLRKRYEVDCFHTYSGLFLVVINPYKFLPIYSPEIVDLYRGKRRVEIAPHIYAVSDEAYRNLLNNRENQSLLITGESGAGKTENTKKVIQYIATVAGRSGGVGELEKQLIELNPVLEAFGNAKTVRNDNSSRFGKFIKLQFSQGGLLSGASVRVYLLEKSRVVTRGKNERAFHIFYQLLAGATQEEKSRFNLRRPEDYHYLRVSDCYRVDSLNDVEEFKHTRVAMDMCGISPEQQAEIFAIVSGIMHLGNVRFRQGAGEGGECDSPAEVAAAAAQFGVDPQVLETALLHPKIEAGGKLVSLHLTREQAEHAREATSKDIYNRLFLWIVARMNKLLSQPNSAGFIGVLDIAGFEIFEFNSFEQLCINYTNERLQAFFNNHMFTLEQEEYEREKIQWTWVDFGIDSTQVIDLICKKPNGIFPTLDEQCVFPKATDLTFLEKLHGTHARSPKYSKPQFAGEPTFKLTHYAGQVTYNVVDWLEKNKDPLAADIKSCLRASRLNLLADCYNDNFMRDVERAQSPTANPNRAPLAGMREGPNRGNQGAQFMTIAKKYDQQLGELMATLNSTYPHFVRCIIPNYQKRPGYLCADVVLEQLRCNGVLEGIRISRKGFPNRLVYKEFVKRYHLLGTKIPAHSPDPRSDTETLVGQLIQQEIIHPRFSKDFKDVADLYRFGLSKIFFRAGQLSSIEGERERRVGKLVQIVQAATRGWLARNLYRKLRTRDLAAKVIRRNLKAYNALSNWPWWKLFVKARPAVKEYDREAEVRIRENKIKELAGQVRTAEKERDDLRLRLEDSIAEISELSKKVDRNNSLLAEAEASRDKLQKEFADAISKLKAAESDLDEETELTDRLQTVKGDLEKQVAELKTELSAESANRQKLEDEKRQLELARNGLSNELKDSQDDLNDLRNIKKELETKLANLKIELESAEDDVDKLALESKRDKASIEELNEKLEARAGELAKADQNLKKFQSDLRTAQNQVETLEAEKKGLSDTNESLKNKLKIAEEASNGDKQRLENLEREKKKLANELTELQDQLGDGDARYKQMQRARDEVQAQLDTAKDHIEQLEEEKLKLDDDKRKQQIEIGALQKRIAELEEEIAKLQREKRVLEQKIADLESEVESLRTDLSVADKKAKKGNESADELGAELDKIRKDLQAAEKALAKAKKEARDIEVALNQEKSAAAALRERAAVLEGELKSHSEASANDSAREESLKKRVRDLEAEKERLSRQTEDGDKARKAADAKTSAVQDQLQELQERFEEEVQALTKARAQISQLQTQLSATTARADATQESAAKLDASAKALGAENSQLKAAIDDLTRKQAATEKDRKAFEAQAAEAAARADAAEKELQALKKSNQKVSGSAKEAAQKAEQLEASKAQLEVDLRKAQAELQEANSDRAALRAALEGSERSKKSLEAEVDAAHGDLDAANAAKAKAERELRQAKADTAEVETQLADQKDAKKALQKDLDAKIQQIAELQALGSSDSDKLKKSEDLRKKLQAEFDNLRHRCEELESQAGALDKRAKRAEEELAESREQTSNANKETDKQKAALKKANKEISDLKGQLQNTTDTEKVRKLERELTELAEQYEMLEILKGSLEKAKVNAEHELEDLRSQLEDEVRNKNKFLKEVRSLKEQVRELNESIEEEEQLREELEAWKSQAENDLATLRSENNRLQDQFQKADEEKRMVETKLRGQEAEFERLRATNQVLSNKVKSYEGELMEEKLHREQDIKRTQDLTKQKDKLAREHKEVQKKFISETRARLETEKKVAEMTQEMERMKAENIGRMQDYESQIERLKRESASRVADLEEELTAERRSKEVVIKRRRELESELADLKNEFDTIDDQKSEIEFKLSRAESDAATAKRELEQEKEARSRAETRANELDVQLKDIASRTDGVDAKIQALERKNRALESDLEQAQADADEIRRKSGTDSKKRKKLEAQVKQLQQEVIDTKAKATTDNARLERDLRQAREEKEAVSGRFAALDADKTKALAEAQKHRAAANNLEDQLAKLQQELDASNEKCARLDKKVRAFLAEGL